MQFLFKHLTLNFNLSSFTKRTPFWKRKKTKVSSVLYVPINRTIIKSLNDNEVEIIMKGTTVVDGKRAMVKIEHYESLPKHEFEATHLQNKTLESKEGSSYGNHRFRFAYCNTYGKSV